MKFLIFMLFCLSPYFLRSQNIDRGIIIYQVTANLKNIPLPNEIIRKAFAQKNTADYKIIFAEKRCVAFLSTLDSLLVDLKDGNEFSYFNRQKNQFFFIEKKFGKWIKSIDAATAKKIKETGKKMVIAGYNCEEILYESDDEKKYYAWQTIDLPKEAGCIMIQNSKGAIIKNISGEITMEAKKIYSNTAITAAYFNWIDKLPITIEDKKIINSDGEPGILKEGNTMPAFVLKDVGGRNFKTADLKNSVTAFVFWNNFDLQDHFKGKMKIDRNQKDLLKELDQFGLHSATKLNIIAPVTVSKNELLQTNNESLHYKKVRVISGAEKWMQKLQVKSYPLIVLVDKNGVIKKVINYYNSEQESKEIQSQISSLLQSLQ